MTRPRLRLAGTVFSTPDPDAPQMQVDLGIATDDLDAAVAHAIACGARPAEHPRQPDVRVMLVPDGRPFCQFPDDWD